MHFPFLFAGELRRPFADAMFKFYGIVEFDKNIR